MPKHQSVRKCFQASMFAAFFVGTACVLAGCDSDSKIQQVQAGVENLDQYAQEIEAEAQPPAK